MSTIKGLISVRNISSLSASITRPHRTTYTRAYPTVLVHPNGSTTTIRYDEPRQIIKLPVNIWLLSEAERKERLEKRKPKKKVVIDEDFEEDTYDSHEYLKYLKK
ncbi:39S ribosomal protein L55, mitochondrial [Aethina tumida]|uniref:39S ribosomal protein L55, mitochondrial n=1 Tax=Aethina tumida TaxID=116153 RepID=UPI002147F017|nr:39S ribosomal protein L55, mitochondrial [Aethina tumida]